MQSCTFDGDGRSMKSSEEFWSRSNFMATNNNSRERPDVDNWLLGRQRIVQPSEENEKCFVSKCGRGRLLGQGRLLALIDLVL